MTNETFHVFTPLELEENSADGGHPIICSAIVAAGTGLVDVLEDALRSIRRVKGEDYIPALNIALTIRRGTLPEYGDVWHWEVSAFR